MWWLQRPSIVWRHRSDRPGAVLRRAGVCAAAGTLAAAVCVGAPAPPPEAGAGPGQTVVLEAELSPALGYPWRPVRVRGASGGLALAVPEGAGSEEAFGPGGPGMAAFPVPAAGVAPREVWLRVYWNGNCSNSLYAASDAQSDWTVVASHTMRAWHWLRVGGLSIPAEGGLLWLANREDGVWVDQIRIAAVGAPAPVGVLPAVDPVCELPPFLPPAGLALSPGGAEVEALPPTEYLLHHRRSRRLPMPSEPVLPVFPGRETPLDVWVRWNRAGSRPGDVILEGPPGLGIGPRETRRAGEGDEPLECLSFSVRARPDLPRGVTTLLCRLRTAEGLEQVRRVRVVRPYRWLVSQAFRLNPDAGLDQLRALDEQVLAAPLSGPHGLEWREAQPEHYTAFGLLDLRRAVSEHPFVQAYAFARVAAAGGPATLDLTHDDWIRVWVNGDCVFSSQESAPSTLTRARVGVTLRPGENEVLVRCAQLKNYWEFGLVAEAADPAAESAPRKPAPGAAAVGRTPPGGVVLPAWSLHSIAESLGQFMAARPPGQRWQVLAAACQDCPLAPSGTWEMLLAGVQYRLRSERGLSAAETADLLGSAEAVLWLRRRAENDLGLAPWARAGLIRRTFQERAALLEAAGRPVEATEETMGAIAWSAGPEEAGPLHTDVVRRFLAAGAVEEAAAYLDGPAAGLPQAPELRAVTALYRGDTDEAAPLLAGTSPESARKYADWLLRMGRAREAEWLLSRDQAPSLQNRLRLAVAYADQRRFAEAGALLRECLFWPDAEPHEWTEAAAQFAAFHSARCTVPEAVADLMSELGALSHHAEERRLRLLEALVRLHQAAEDPVSALQMETEKAEQTAARYRSASQAMALGHQVRRAMASLSRERRYEEMLRLCNRIVAVAPGLRVGLGVYRLEALAASGRVAAADAMAAQLAEALAGDSRRAIGTLSLLTVSEANAPVAERLARQVLEDDAADPAAAAEAALLLAQVRAVQGRFVECAWALQRTLGGDGLAQRASAGEDDARARYWVARCLELAGGAAELEAALLASPEPRLRQAAAEVLARRGRAPWDWPDEIWEEEGDAPPPGAENPPDWLPAGLLGIGPGHPAHGPSPDAGEPRVAVEPADPPRVWVLAPGQAPVCARLDRPTAPDRFPEAFRPWCETPPAVRDIAFSEGLVWLGTEAGLYCYRRALGSWDRLRWPGDSGRGGVSALRVTDGRLEVVPDAVGEGAGSIVFGLNTWTWAGQPAP